MQPDVNTEPIKAHSKNPLVIPIFFIILFFSFNSQKLQNNIDFTRKFLALSVNLTLWGLYRKQLSL